MNKGQISNEIVWPKAPVGIEFRATMKKTSRSHRIKFFVPRAGGQSLLFDSCGQYFFFLVSCNQPTTRNFVASVSYETNFPKKIIFCPSSEFSVGI